ncbi:MAG: ATP-binding protein [Asticcacaulis sp.]
MWHLDWLWLPILADLAIILGCGGMAAVMLYLRSRNRDASARQLFAIGGVVLLLLSLLPLGNVWTMWYPYFLAEAVIRVVVAIAILSCLIMLMQIAPRAFSLARKPVSPVRADSEFHDTLVEHVLDGVITIDATGRIQSFNPACETIFGYRAAEVTGKPIAQLMPDPTYNEHDRYVGDYLDTNAASREVRGRRKDGSEFPLDLSVSAYEVDGSTHYTGIVRDITKVKQAELNRQALLKRLTESNTELERFAYVASHDMQEPLRMVLTFSQIIASDYHDKLDEEGLEYLRIIGESAARMRDMVEDLLDYARLDKAGFRFVPVDMQAELNHVLENLHSLMQENRATLSADDLPVVPGNGVQLMRLLQNLISNGIKYSFPNRRPVIHIGVREKDDEWRFSVCDNGCGIQADFLDQIFEPFRRLHGYDGVRGTGLGLSVCKKIVENHGGQIWVESEPDLGSTFTFTLPKNSPSA